MRFWIAARCVQCRNLWEFITPIPDLVVRMTPCCYCGVGELVGFVPCEPEDGGDLNSESQELEDLPY